MPKKLSIEAMLEYIVENDGSSWRLVIKSGGTPILTTDWVAWANTEGTTGTRTIDLDATENHDLYIERVEVA